MKGSHKTDQEAADAQGAALLDKIKHVPQRSESAAQNGRALFMQQAQTIKAALPGSPREPRALRPSLFQRKWLFGLNPLLTILIIAAFVLASTSTTVYAAQGSTPNHFLYPVKIASEDLRLSLAPSSKDKVVMDIEFANRRLQEVSSLAQNEQNVPGAVSTRWGSYLDDVFEHSRQMNDAQMAETLSGLQSGLNLQLQTTDRLLNNHPADSGLLKLHNEIYASVRLVEFGLSNPSAFRQQIKAAGGSEIEHEMQSLKGESDGLQLTPTGVPESGPESLNPASSAVPESEKETLPPIPTLTLELNKIVSPETGAVSTSLPGSSRRLETPFKDNSGAEQGSGGSETGNSPSANPTQKTEGGETKNTDNTGTSDGSHPDN